jgi:hypothetical protein
VVQERAPDIGLGGAQQPAYLDLGTLSKYLHAYDAEADSDQPAAKQGSQQQ